MKRLLFTALFFTAACGSNVATNVAPNPTPTPIPVQNSTQASCEWVDPNATFFEYDSTNATEAHTPSSQDANALTVNAQWEDATEAHAFTVTLQIDANNVPWVAAQGDTFDYEFDACLSSIKLDETHFASWSYDIAPNEKYHTPANSFIVFVLDLSNDETAVYSVQAQ